MKEETKKLLDEAAKKLGYFNWQDVYRRLGEKQFKLLQHSQVEAIIEDAIEAAKPKWISVTERMPEKLVTVLLKDSKDIEIGFLSTSGYFITYNGERLSGITHWQPLPETDKF